jgi:hypothetical protein
MAESIGQPPKRRLFSPAIDMFSSPDHRSACADRDSDPAGMLFLKYFRNLSKT